MNSVKLCIFILALAASSYAIDESSSTYYTAPFSIRQSFHDTIESQWQGIDPPGVAIYGWNVTAIGATFINISRADIVTSNGVHYNMTHNKYYHLREPTTLHGFHLEVADPCVMSLAKDETFRVYYHAETNGNDGRWGQYLRTETVPSLVLPSAGFGVLAIPVCRKVYTPDLVCEMISNRFVKLSISDFQAGHTEEFDVIIETPITNINETLSYVAVTSNNDCPTFLHAPTRRTFDLTRVNSKLTVFTVMAHSESVWIMIGPANKLHNGIEESYFFTVRSKRVLTPAEAGAPLATGPSGGAIFGIVVAVLAGVGIVGFALYYFRAKWMPGQNNYSNL